MADGATFDISIEAQSLGVESSAAELNAFAEKLQKTNAVATQFDSAIAAARKRLEETASAAKLAADALKAGETRYRELESAANRAAKAVEKAASKGEDTSALQAAAAAAAAKMREQASAVDDLRRKSTAAEAAQRKLTTSLKTLEGEAASAATEMKKTTPAIDGTTNALKGLGGGDKVEKIQKLKAAFSTLHGATLITAVGVAAMTAAMFAGVVAMGAFAVKSSPTNMQKLSAAVDRVHKGFVALFSGIKLDKFIAALEDIMSLFDEGTSSASGLKKLVETILQPMIDAATFLAPYVKEMFKGMIHGALQVAIAVLKARNEIFKMLPPETRAAIKEFIDHTFTLQNAFKLGTGIAIALAAVVVVLTVALAAMAVAELAALWPVLLIVAAVAAVIAAFVYWDQIMANLSATFDGIKADVANLASNLIDGLVNGIKSGAKWVIDALKNLAKSGVDAFKSALGISSPSKVFALQAHYTAQGYVEGIEDSAPAVGSALESMVSPADASGAAPSVSGGQRPPPTGGASAGARTVHIENLTVGAGEVAAANWVKVKQLLLEAVEGASFTIGGGEAPAT